MQRHSLSETNQIIQNNNDNKISVNCLLPNHSKLLSTLYPNSGEELQSEKFKTYRDSAMSNSEFFSEFIFENEEKPFQITPYKEEHMKTLTKEKKKISSRYNFIKDFKYYIHCNTCLTIIAGENELHHETKSFLKVSTIFNSNSTFTNTTFDYNEKKEEELNKIYDILYCTICGNNLGIDLTKFKEYILSRQLKIERPQLSSVSTFLNSLSKYCLFKSRIAVRSMKNLKVGLCGLKVEILKEIENSLNDIIKLEKDKYDNEEDISSTEAQKQYDENSISFPTIEFVILKQTKDSLQNFSLIKNTKQFSDLDIIFIVHKMEGRVFLVGRNGYYNKLYENLYNLLKGNFLFLLSYKKLDGDDSLESKSEILDNLITKGDQQLLETFREENKIVFINDVKYTEDIKKKKLYFSNLFYKKFVIDQNNTTEPEEGKKISFPINTNFINSQTRQFTNEEFLAIDQLIIKLKNKILTDGGKSREFLKCFVL